MVTLYWSAGHPNHWIACLENGSWVQFPAEVDGWVKRQVARHLDPLAIRRVPKSRAFNTGFPTTDETAEDIPVFSPDVLDDVA